MATKKIEVFRPGAHTAGNGAALNFSADDVRGIVETYDPAVFSAPLVVGHPRTDDPAYGWVANLSTNAEGVIEAEPEDIEPQFAELVKKKRFKKISVSLFPPGHAAHPKPKSGKYYLKHVGFLGAAAPAVTGLKNVQFATDDAAVEIEFSYADGWTLKTLLRSLREYLIDDKGIEKANELMPGYLIDSIERPETGNNGPCYAANPTVKEEISDMSTEETKRREQELADREQKLKDREATFAANELAAKESAKKARQDAALAFCQTLVTGGKLVPKHVPALAGALAEVDALETVSYSEDGAAKAEAPGAILRRVLQDGTGSVPHLRQRGAPASSVSEFVAPQGEGARVSVANFASPEGTQVDQSEAATHNAIVAYSAKNGVTYEAAMRVVTAGGQ